MQVTKIAEVKKGFLLIVRSLVVSSRWHTLELVSHRIYLSHHSCLILGAVDILALVDWKEGKVVKDPGLCKMLLRGRSGFLLMSIGR